VKISKKAEYALRAMVILADTPPNQPHQIQDLADKGSVPVKFLEQILLMLKRSGLLKSKRGVGGGYQLNREARTISVAEVIESIDGTLCSLAPDAAESPDFRGANGLRETLQKIDRTVNDQLRAQSLEDILESESDAGAGFMI